MASGLVLPDGIVESADQTHLDCPVITKSRVISFPRGTAATLQWEVRDGAGRTVDLTGLLGTVDFGTTTTTANPSSLAQVVFRFRMAGSASPTVYQVIGDAWEADQGLVRVDIPSTVYDCPGIWLFDVAVSDDEGYVRVIDSGMISVERSMFISADPSVVSQGPLTLDEIRIHLRDTAAENDLSAEVEFDDTEIIQAIIRPIQEWNETPPTVAIFDTGNFPYRYWWLQAVTASLLMTAAHWYRRNKLQIQTKGGINDDSKNRDQAYTQAAMLLRQEWKEWMRHKKVEINMRLASGSIGSPYGGGW